MVEDHGDAPSDAESSSMPPSEAEPGSASPASPPPQTPAVAEGEQSTPAVAGPMGAGSPPLDPKRIRRGATAGVATALGVMAFLAWVWVIRPAQQWARGQYRHDTEWDGIGNAFTDAMAGGAGAVGVLIILALGGVTLCPLLAGLFGATIGPDQRSAHGGMAGLWGLKVGCGLNLVVWLVLLVWGIGTLVWSLLKG